MVTVGYSSSCYRSSCCLPIRLQRTTQPDREKLPFNSNESWNTSTFLLCCGRINYGPDLCDLVRGEPTLPSVLTHGFLVRCNVDTVDLVISDVTLNPLDLRPDFSQNAARLL